MATIPISPQNTTEEQELTHDQWWDLFHHLRLSQQAAYAAEGGPVESIRRQRDADEPSSQEC